MPDSSTSVIVVGAGPAGVSLAYLLASRGVSVTLLERQRDFAREFRGEVLLPSGLEALQQSGLVHADGRVGGVTVRSQTGEQTLHSDLVVGAAGRSSVIRRACDFDVRKHGLDVDVVWCKMPLPPFLGGQAPLRVYVGRAHLLIAYRAADGLLQVAWVITKGTYGEVRRRGISEWVEKMAHHVTPDLGVHLRAHSRSLTHPFLLSAVSDRVTQWSVPGALVIGDAAHTMSPVGGQGINIALRDAVVTANHIVPVLRQTTAADRIDAATQAIESERTPELAHIQRLQAIPPRLLMGHTWWGAMFRATVPRLLRYEVVRRRVTPVVRTILFGHGDVRLQV